MSISSNFRDFLETSSFKGTEIQEIYQMGAEQALFINQIRSRIPSDPTEIQINLQQYNRPLGSIMGWIEPVMIGTSGTSKSVREELITSLESRLPGVVDKLLTINIELGCVDKSQLNDRLITFAKRSSLGVLNSLTPDELERRVERILVLESAISAFKELTPDQRKILDELIDR
jgi:hypothetical protein